MSEQIRPASGVEPLFSFVVVADTHVNEGEQISASPYATNRLANARARYVFEEIARIDPPPRFVVHLGDIVNPVPSLPTFHDAVGHFKAIAEPLRVPLHVIPGNHDVGDKTIDWMPADQVCDAYLATYRAVFGADFYAFDDGDLRFVMLNSLLLNSGLADEARQRDWLEAQLDGAAGRRVFLFMHYPPYIHSREERGSYDNIDRPARDWLLEQIARPGVEAVFAGHVHNFWYDRIGEAELYMLPSTAFVRHDFSEFYRVAPKVEFGRGDPAKFGYFRVDVFAHGHVAYSVRTMGRHCAPGEAPAVPARRYLAHPKTAGFTQVGVELRHPWAEVTQITSTGGVQEFGRKWARNDYPQLALWEMGVRLCKLTDADLFDAEPRARMRLMARIGQRYLVTVLGAPRERLLAAADADRGVIAFEANLTLDGFAAQRATLRAARERAGAAVYFSKLLTHDASHFDGKHYSHFVKSGFTPEELEQHRTLIASACAAGDIDGVTVRVAMDEPLPVLAARLRAFAADAGCRLLVSLKLAGPGIAQARTDDRETTARAAQAMVLSRVDGAIAYVFDTFMDVDRGYYPRHAFIDRCFDPRPAAGVFATLAALFPGEAPFALIGEPRDDAIAFAANGQRWRLLCAAPDEAIARIAQCAPGARLHELHLGIDGDAAQVRAAIEAARAQSPRGAVSVLIRDAADPA